jgi:hypothetical protein
VKGRLEVWQVIMVARNYPEDTVAKTADHLVLRPEQARAALDYYAAYPEEIDAALAENDEGFERLKRLLPNIKRVTLSKEDLASVRLADPTP